MQLIFNTDILKMLKAFFLNGQGKTRIGKNIYNNWKNL